MTVEQGAEVISLLGQLVDLLTFQGDFIQVLAYSVLALIGVVLGVSLVFLVRGFFHV